MCFHFCFHIRIHISYDQTGNAHAVIDNTHRHMLCHHRDFRIILDCILNNAVCTEYIPSYYDIHLAGKLCQIICFLQRRVAAADDHNLLIAEKCTVAYCTIGYTASDIFQFPRHIHHTLLCSGCHNDSLCLILRSILTDDFFICAILHTDDIAIQVFRTKGCGMLKHIACQLGTVCFNNARPVADFRRLDQLSSGSTHFQHCCFQAGSASIYCRTHAGRSGTNDN